MSTSKGIYIDALGYGVIHLNEGVSFNKVIQHLRDLKYKIEGEYFGYFHRWFYLNYFHETMTRGAYFAEDKHDPYKNWKELFIGVDDSLCIIMSEGYMKYMEYVELEQARQSSKRAQIIAIIAIVISIVFAIASIGIDIFSTAIQLLF